MNIDSVLTNPPYSARRDREHQASDCDLFTEDDISEMVNICGDSLKPGAKAKIFFSSFQLSSWVNSVTSSTECGTFQNSEDNAQVRDEVLFDQEKQGLVSERDWRTFTRKPSHCQINMEEHVVHFWGKGFGLDHMLLNLSYHPNSRDIRSLIPSEHQCDAESPEAGIRRIYIPYDIFLSAKFYSATSASSGPLRPSS